MIERRDHGPAASRSWVAGGELALQGEGAKQGPGSHKRTLCDLLEERETVTRALKRLRPVPTKAGSKRKTACGERHSSADKRRGRKSTSDKGTDTQDEAAALKVQFDKVTDAAAELMNMGFEDIYVMTREQILESLDDGFNLLRGTSKYVWHDDGDERDLTRPGGDHRDRFKDSTWQYGPGNQDQGGAGSQGQVKKAEEKPSLPRVPGPEGGSPASNQHIAACPGLGSGSVGGVKEGGERKCDQGRELGPAEDLSISDGRGGGSTTASSVAVPVTSGPAPNPPNQIEQQYYGNNARHAEQWAAYYAQYPYYGYHHHAYWPPAQQHMPYSAPYHTQPPAGASHSYPSGGSYIPEANHVPPTPPGHAHPWSSANFVYESSTAGAGQPQGYWQTPP